MPYTVAGEPGQGTTTDFSKRSYDYDYPNNLDLRPGSDFHSELKGKIITRARESRNEMSKRFPSWNEIDRVLTTYIPLKDKEEKLKKKDTSKPVSIVFPYTYAMLEALLTYLCAAFFQDPMFQYEGVEGSDVQGSMLLEQVIRLHCIKTKVSLALHTVIRNSLSYGIGPGAPGWEKKFGKRPIKTQLTTVSESGGSQTENGVQFIEDLIFEGNRLDTIDPYMYLPDPSVSAHEVQSGEFVGWIVRDNLMNMLSEEALSDGEIFNVKYLKSVRNKKSSFSTDQSDRNIKYGGQDPRNITAASTNHVDNIYMYINLIPKEWKLGSSEYPEKWLFALSSDEVITSASKCDHNHGMYPVSTAAPEFDGYSPTPIGRLEILYGLQHTLDFLFNCYDDKTEVLTSIGWTNLAKAKEANLDVATVNPDNGTMWFEKPKEWFEYDYDGILNLFESKRYSLAVTPNHKMFGRCVYGKVIEFITSDSLYEGGRWNNFEIPTTVNFIGKQPELLKLGPVKREGSTGRLPRQYEVEIPFDILAGFLGWFLSDGSICKGKTSGTYSITIKQSKKQFFDEIDHFTENLPFHVGKYYNEDKESWQWSIMDKGFFLWLKDNCYHEGTTGEFKEVPDIIRNADNFTLNRFFEAFVHGDGHIVDGHDNLYQVGTESKQLADDLQEIAIKLGYSCSIRNTSTTLGKPFWYLNVNKNASWAQICPRNRSKIRYIGKVYCFENSTHLTVVRRNGKVSICGQSHVANVRKSINDMFVVDPYLININDLKDPKPGKLIRLRRPAWGRGVDKVVQQLAVNDITRNNIADSAYITQWMDKISGADQSMMGALRQGGPERLTRSEFQGTRGSAISRLQRIAMLIGTQFMQDIGHMFAVHTQQYMTKDTYVKITGRNQEKLSKIFGKERAPVSPYDLAVNYDTIVRDGSIPGGNFSEVWVQLFDIISKSEPLTREFDTFRLFSYIATELGAKNIEDFKRNANNIQATTMPDEDVVREAEKGNLVPL